MTRFFFGHHKAATHWLSAIVKQVCDERSVPYAYLYSPKQFDFDLSRWARAQPGFFSYTNADMRYVEPLDRFRAFHVIRDPRDIAVSSYFSHRYSHATDTWPELARHRADLERLPLHEGLLLDMQWSRSLPCEGVVLRPFDCMRDWDYRMPHCMEVRFEDLIASPQTWLRDMFAFVEMPLTEPGLGRIMQSHDFTLLASRPPGQEDPTHHYRKGIAGDWRNYFQEDHKRFFKQSFGGLVEKLGYESSDRW